MPSAYCTVLSVTGFFGTASTCEEGQALGNGFFGTALTFEGRALGGLEMGAGLSRWSTMKP